MVPTLQKEEFPSIFNVVNIKYNAECDENSHLLINATTSSYSRSETVCSVSNIASIFRNGVVYSLTATLMQYHRAVIWSDSKAASPRQNADNLSSTSSVNHALNPNSCKGNKCRWPITLHQWAVSILSSAKDILSFAPDIRSSFSTFITWPVRWTTFAFSPSLHALLINICSACLPNIPYFSFRPFFKGAGNDATAPEACVSVSPIFCCVKECWAVMSASQETSVLYVF